VVTSQQTVVRSPAATSISHVDVALDDLVHARQTVARRSIGERIRLANACADDVLRVAWDWVEASCHAKGVSSNNTARAEEIATGPLATMRYLRLLTQSLRDVERCGQPRVPRVAIAPDGRLRVSVFPCSGQYDQLMLWGFRADAWLNPGVTLDNMWANIGRQVASPRDAGWVSLVLGAGNISSIPATDALGRLVQQGHSVLLKLNPVNEYLAPIFECAFEPLLNEGCLRIVTGGTEVGAATVTDDRIDEIHLTGSIETHDSIVWGRTLEEREQRKLTRDPAIRKPLTSELGNVTPWIIVPGPYSNHQLRFQAGTIAAALTTNAGFNCVSPRVLVTWRRWRDRERFVDSVQSILNQTPPRKSYYPGAVSRHERLVGRPDSTPEGTLPWTLIRDADPQDWSHFFRSEWFVNVCVEVALDADSEAEFLDKAADFVNGELWGTLAAAVTIHPATRWPGAHDRRFQEFLGRLKYNTIAINHSPGLMFAIMSPPWGGGSRGTMADPQSGLGWVHNTFLLDRVDKTVLEGPLVVYPLPFWMPSHPEPEQVAWRLLRLYHQPSPRNLAGVLTTACRHPW
jgi:hypothetical protein